MGIFNISVWPSRNKGTSSTMRSTKVREYQDTIIHSSHNSRATNLACLTGVFLWYRDYVLSRTTAALFGRENYDKDDPVRGHLINEVTRQH